MDPPHHWVPFTLKLTCHGHSPSLLFEPPTMRLKRGKTLGENLCFEEIDFVPQVNLSIIEMKVSYLPFFDSKPLLFFTAGER